jgi:hypothetical protein
VADPAARTQPHFSRTELDNAWERRIGPLIEEYFFDQPDIAADFTINTFWP